MNWLLRPPIILGWFEALPYRLGGMGVNPKKSGAQRLTYWDMSADIRSPKAQIYGFLTGSIIWVAATFIIVMPLLGWLVSLGAPVPAALFWMLMLLPVAMLIYVGILLPSAPTKSRSVTWLAALSWPVEAAVALLVGVVSWFLG